ncbi:hypothetical protein ACVBEH_26045, partial [Roseateles sp. GG27B]
MIDHLSGRFTLRRPQANPEAVAPRRLRHRWPLESRPVSFVPMRLLLVEDSLKLAAWLGRALRQHGFAVDV